MKREDFVKTLCAGLGVFFLTAAAYAGEVTLTEKDTLDTNTSAWEIEVCKKYWLDAALEYRGIIGPDGFAVLENKSTGITVSGYIDARGYGDLRDASGYRILKVRPE